MKLIWINVLAILIALTSLMIEGPVLNSNLQLSKSSIQHMPIWDSNAIKNDSKKNSEKTLQIAQDFIPVVVIADSLEVNQSFKHYLPLHNLFRQKEYFLLI